MNKELLEKQLQELRFSVMSVISFAEKHVGKGSFESRQLAMMSFYLGRKFTAASDELKK